MSATDNENVRELLGREKKISRIFVALELAMRHLGVPPDRALEHVEHLPPGAWIDLARRAGCRPLSSDSIAAVIAFYRDERPALLARMGA